MTMRLQPVNVILQAMSAHHPLAHVPLMKCGTALRNLPVRLLMVTGVLTVMVTAGARIMNVLIMSVRVTLCGIA